mmetsp:Transcript_4667/g.17847  ORF Transcript_4667/g.17847 Transcript_4667/m.17847 type:complete len:90 (+) Transcript_4667:1368-1637(+)
MSTNSSEIVTFLVAVTLSYLKTVSIHRAHLRFPFLSELIVSIILVQYFVLLFTSLCAAPQTFVFVLLTTFSNVVEENQIEMICDARQRA